MIAYKNLNRQGELSKQRKIPVYKQIFILET